jgi:hypothetical protein
MTRIQQRYQYDTDIQLMIDIDGSGMSLFDIFIADTGSTDVEKKLIKESLGYSQKGKKTFSDKKQNIIITESQLEKLLEKLQK